MQSIFRTFTKYFHISLKRDVICNNIIFAQASRHAIVHSLGVADRRFIRQINNATPRDIKLTLKEKDSINYNIEELETVRLSMLKFVNTLCVKP